jgi:hypothetical protein
MPSPIEEDCVKLLSKSGVVLLVGAVAVSFASVASSGTPGRFKKGPNGSCTWDERDSGPDQCQPAKGRFKKNGDKCVWDANDSGANQCNPQKGRYKKDGDKCVWDANDSGPDQCKPR